jgi:hypothetical protein
MYYTPLHLELLPCNGVLRSVKTKPNEGEYTIRPPRKSASLDVIGVSRFQDLGTGLIWTNGVQEWPLLKLTNVFDSAREQHLEHLKVKRIRIRSIYK